MLCALLAHAPAKRVNNIRFAATIRTYDADDVVVKMNNGSVDKRLEPANLERFDVHRIVLIYPLIRPVGQLIHLGRGCPDSR